MADLSPASNAPVTAASIVAAAGLCLAAFGDFSAEQVAAVQSVIGIIAAVVLQKFHVNPKGA